MAADEQGQWHAGRNAGDSHADQATTVAEREHDQDAATPRRHRIRLGWRLAFRTGAGQARGFLRFWPVWERIMQRFEPVQAIPSAPYGLILVHARRYRGKPVTLPDGTLVAAGDRVLEIHMKNHLLAQIPGGLGLYRKARQDFAALAAWSWGPDFPPNVRALYGFSLLSRGAARLGFFLRDRPITLRVRLERFFLLGLMALYHGEGVERLRRGTTYEHYPQELWLSIGELRRLYARPGEHPPAAVS
jgi:hypothetical protein